MVFCFIFIFIFCFSLKQCSQLTIKLEYSSLGGRIEISMHLSNKNIYLKGLINQNQSTNIFTSNSFTKAKYRNQNNIGSNVINDVIIEHHKEEFKFLKLKNTIIDLHYFITEDTDIQNSFAFGLNVDREHSIVYKLFEMGITSSLEYTLFPELLMDGTIYFGPFNISTEYSIMSNKPLGKCRSHSKYNSWGCIIRSVFYNNMINTAIKYNDYAAFAAHSNITIIPYNLYQYISKVALNENIINGTCNEEYKNGEYTFHCNKLNTVMYIEKMNFVFDTMIVKIRMIELFDCYEDRGCFSIFRSIEDRKKEWVFAAKFLKNFISTYNYEDKTVRLIPRLRITSVVPLIVPLKLNTRKILFTLNCVFGVIAVMFNMWVYLSY